MNLRTRKVLRDIWGNKARTLLVVVSIALGLLAMSTVFRARAILARDVQESLAAINPAAATLLTQPIDTQVVDSVRDIEAVEEAEEASKAPEPTAIDDEKITILKHDIYRKGGDDAAEAISIELAIKNISDTVIGSALFEAELYDIEGNILDKVEQKTVDFKPNVSRTIRINYSEPKSDKVRSYCVRVAKIIMTPEPVFTGNGKIRILKHILHIGNESYRLY